MLPYLTAGVPGCGGAFKASAEDFEVEEVPAYAPSGEGEHLFLWVEKRGKATREVALQLARALSLKERDVSWAGLKDRQAVTRQFLCLPARAVVTALQVEAKDVEAAAVGLALDGATVLRAARHRNKLKSGHLAGNRFRLSLRGVTDAGAAKTSLARLSREGVPNFYGEQRFGLGGDNAQKGKALLLAGGRHRDRFERKLFLSAYQSDLFNRVLALRLERGLFARALKGDWLKKHETGGEFRCETPEVDQPRVDAFEVSPLGPMFGPKMRAATDDALALEQEILSAEGVTVEIFAAGGDETQGTRRLNRVRLEGLTVEGSGDALTLAFTLPAGAYATVVLRELLKDR